MGGNSSLKSSTILKTLYTFTFVPLPFIATGFVYFFGTLTRVIDPHYRLGDRYLEETGKVVGRMRYTGWRLFGADVSVNMMWVIFGLWMLAPAWLWFLLERKIFKQLYRPFFSAPFNLNE